MKKIDWKLVFELMKNSRRSDRELAKEVDSSQPTVSRRRKRLEREGIIREYTMVPDFVKVGFEILAITLTKTKFDPALKERAIKSVMAKPNIVLCARSEGMGKNGIIVSIHKDYTCYSNFIQKHMEEWKDVIKDYSTVVISLKGTVLKPFSLKYLTEILKDHFT